MACPIPDVPPTKMAVGIEEGEYEGSRELTESLEGMAQWVKVGLLESRS